MWHILNLDKPGGEELFATKQISLFFSPIKVCPVKTDQYRKSQHTLSKLIRDVFVELLKKKDLDHTTTLIVPRCYQVAFKEFKFLHKAVFSNVHFCMHSKTSLKTTTNLKRRNEEREKMFSDGRCSPASRRTSDVSQTYLLSW